LTTGSGHFEFTTLSEFDTGDREVWRRLTAEIVDSNPAEGMVFALLCLLCDLYVSAFATSWSLVDKSPTVCVCVCVCACARARASNREWSRNLNNEAPYAQFEKFPHRNKDIASKPKEPLRGRPIAVCSEHGVLWERRILKAIVEISEYQVLYINNYSVLRILKEKLKRK
jgi:hypothetical protein